MASDRKPLPLADLIGEWKFTVLYGKWEHFWVKFRTLESKDMVWTFRQDGTVIQHYANDPEKTEPYEYDETTGKLLIGKPEVVREDYYVFEAGEREAYLYSLLFEFSRTTCRLRHKIKKSDEVGRGPEE